MVTSYAVKGTDLQVSINSTYTSIGQIVSVDAPGMKVGKRDVTHLLSATKEYEPTIGDPQEFKGTILYNPSDPGVVFIQTRCTTPSTVAGGDAFKVIFPSTAKNFAFTGFFTEFTPKGGDVEGSWMADFAIQPSRAITYPTT